MKIDGRTAIVTGASAGLGREIATALAAKGARVVAVARREELLRELAAEVEGIVPMAGDVTDDDDRARIIADSGEVDILVNNAGRGWIGPIDKVPQHDVREMFELNVLALIDLSQRVLPQMLDRGRGHICNIGSIAGFVGAPPLSMYSATKFAVHGYTEGLRREMTGRGVDVSLVAPGPFDTEFTDRAPVAGGLAGFLKGRFDAGSVLPPWMVANAVVRAVEHDASYGYAEISVPRAVGLYRLGSVPGVSLAVDAISRGIRLVSDRTVDDPVPSGQRPPT
jgi:short-subunit dehydrogenase